MHNNWILRDARKAELSVPALCRARARNLCTEACAGVLTSMPAGALFSGLSVAQSLAQSRRNERAQRWKTAAPRVGRLGLEPRTVGLKGHWTGDPFASVRAASRPTRPFFRPFGGTIAGTTKRRNPTPTRPARPPTGPSLPATLPGGVPPW